jgi:hypothetical protein
VSRCRCELQCWICHPFFWWFRRPDSLTANECLPRGLAARAPSGRFRQLGPGESLQIEKSPTLQRCSRFGDRSLVKRSYVLCVTEYALDAHVVSPEASGGVAQNREPIGLGEGHLPLISADPAGARLAPGPSTRVPLCVASNPCAQLRATHRRGKPTTMTGATCTEKGQNGAVSKATSVPPAT